MDTSTLGIVVLTFVIGFVFGMILGAFGSTEDDLGHRYRSLTKKDEDALLDHDGIKTVSYVFFQGRQHWKIGNQTSLPKGIYIENQREKVRVVVDYAEARQLAKALRLMDRDTKSSQKAKGS